MTITLKTGRNLCMLYLCETSIDAIRVTLYRFRYVGSDFEFRLEG